MKLWKGEPVPEPKSFHLLILMGGPMSVNDEDLYSFLSVEKIFVRRWVEEGTPTMGICLGATRFGISDINGSPLILPSG